MTIERHAGGMAARRSAGIGSSGSAVAALRLQCRRGKVKSALLPGPGGENGKRGGCGTSVWYSTFDASMTTMRSTEAPMPARSTPCYQGYAFNTKRQDKWMISTNHWMTTR